MREAVSLRRSNQQRKTDIMSNTPKRKRQKVTAKHPLRPDVARAKKAPAKPRFPSYLLEAALATGAVLGLVVAFFARTSPSVPSGAGGLFVFTAINEE